MAKPHSILRRRTAWPPAGFHAELTRAAPALWTEEILRVRETVMALARGQARSSSDGTAP